MPKCRSVRCNQLKKTIHVSPNHVLTVDEQASHPLPIRVSANTCSRADWYFLVCSEHVIPRPTMRTSLAARAGVIYALLTINFHQCITSYHLLIEAFALSVPIGKVQIGPAHPEPCLLQR